MLAIVDYGVGNLFSLCSSLEYIGESCIITGDKEEIRKSDRIILPGVGAFGDAMDKLKKSGLNTVIKEEAASGKPLLGICLGMQMLFEKSYEYGEHEGLGLLSGEVRPLKGDISEKLNIPHMGWNALKLYGDCPIFKYTNEGDYVYFVHSYYAKGEREELCASAEYDIDVTAAAFKNNVFGTQFHPEKSGEVGARILRAFCEIRRE